MPAKVRKRAWESIGGEIKTAWVVDYFDQNRKRHIKTFEFKKDAEAWRVKTEGEIQQGKHTPERSSITVADAAKLWLERGEAEGLERATLSSYKNLAHHINEALGSVKLSKLTTPMVAQFKDRLLKTCLTRRTAAGILGALKAIISNAQIIGHVAHNPALPVNLGMKSRDQRKIVVGRDIPSKEEIQTIIAKAEGRYRPLLITAIFTGMRASEIRGLRWRDVDFERKIVSVHQRADEYQQIGLPKSKAGQREIPISPMVVNTLREWKLACPKGKLDLVFPNGIGNLEYHTNIMYRGFYKLQHDVGMVDEHGKPKYGLHSLRHFAASHWIEQRILPKKIQSYLGHSSIKMTYDVYGHLLEAIDDDDHDKLAAAEEALLGNSAGRGLVQSQPAPSKPKRAELSVVGKTTKPRRSVL